MESRFQFTNPALVKLTFIVNEEFQRMNTEEINISINLSISITKAENKNEARVALNLILGEKGSNSPFYIEEVEAADFRWDECIDKEMVGKLLNQNAPSLLLSYLRPIITQMTAASPFDTFNIPFINFTTQN